MGECRTGLLGVALIAAIGASAHAQSNASVDALVTLFQPELPLVVSGTRSMTFGTLNIPNGTNGEARCRYIVSGSEATRARYLAEISATDVILDSTYPTASGCGYGADSVGTGELGVFQIDCNPETSVNLAVTFNQGELGGVTLRRPTIGSTIGTYNSAQLTGTLGSSGAATMTARCPTAGQMWVTTGAEIVVEKTALETQTPTPAGSLLLEASY